jgi:hypothetical protein
MNLKQLLTSIEFKAFLVLAVVMAFLLLVVMDYNDKRRVELLQEYNDTCGELSEGVKEFLNESSNISCNCYYEPINTGVEDLDKFTKPLCTCDCLRNGVLSKISLRAV